MRTIKFRGKSLKDGEFEYGSLLTYQKSIDIEGDNHVFAAITYEGLEPIDVEPNTVGQFTGLLDKNGKEIYEGDIVKCDKFVYEVVFEENRFASFGLCRKGDMFMHYFGEAMESQQCEVIGNIHDNPELLKGE